MVDTPARLAGWGGVDVLEFDTPSSRRTSVRRSCATSSSARRQSGPSVGRTLVDFGQNLVGWLRLTRARRAGHEITLRHAEVLEDGELGIRPLRTRAATDQFILSGGDGHLRTDA